MPIIRRRGWEIPEHQVTPEAIAMNRRSLMKGVGAAGLLLAGGRAAMANDPAPTDNLHPYARNAAYTVERELTPERITSRYNNFYEFGTTKNIWEEAQALKTRPWTIKVDGLVEQPFEIGIDDLITAMPREERIYRFRCVEAWAMTVPWSGFPLRQFVEWCEPKSDAKYLVMQTFQNPRVAPGQRATWYPWPYTEGLAMDEAMNELSFIATGLYGKPIPRQNGAPLRLVVPWKYGFK
ncbi:MAG: protein-methionine-sulfoxide reductase catalytic subunit MsrP, partial [Rhabdaerophilum sp.]